MKKKTLITSALLYANGQAHFGHIAGAYLPADIYARYRRLQGDDVLFLSGSDEYGMPITLSAEKEGTTPQEHVDKYHAMNKALFSQCNFSFDYYARTTWEGHGKTVLAFFQQLKENDFIVEKKQDHLYSEKEKRFLADRYIIGTCPRCGFTEARGDECTSCAANYESLELKNPRSKLTGSPLVLRKSTHCYLRFDKCKEQLRQWIAKKKWKENVLKFSEQYIENLRERAITRDSSWGIPITLDDGSKKVFYVWFDAPIGYISAAKQWAKTIGEPELWKDFWLDDATHLVQFVGKDNIPFHSVFFPAMILGQNIPYKLVDQLPANEFLQLEGKKFSKSDGHYIDLTRFFTNYTSDQIRYYLAANAPETADANFSWKDFQSACNADLLGKLGNFVHRVFLFAKRHCSDVTLQNVSSSTEAKKFLEDVVTTVDNACANYDTFHVRKATENIRKIASLGNAFFNACAPWTLIKQGKIQEVQEILFACFSCMKFLALTCFPILPIMAQKLWEMLGFTSDLSQEKWSEVVTKTVQPVMTKEPELLFIKIEDAAIKKEQEMLEEKDSTHNTIKPTIPALKKAITFSEFSSLDMRIVTVLHAEKVPKSSKLLRLEVDLGFTKKQVVSGIAQSFSPEDLIGKKVLFVANLEPVKIMGILSEGMILAAGMGKNLELPTVESAVCGTVVS